MVRKTIQETWNIKGKNRAVFVIRDKKGRLKSWTTKKGSGLTKQKAIEQFNKRGTIQKSARKRKIRKSEVIFKNFVEVTETRESPRESWKTKMTPSRPDYEIVQYVVKGVYKGQEVVARSQKLKGSRPDSPDTKLEAKNQAWNNFFKLLSVAGVDREDLTSDLYDADEGIDRIRAGEVTDIREGWVYYRPR